MLVDLSGSTFSGGRRPTRRAIGTPGGRDLNAEGSQGFQRVPTPKPRVHRRLPPPAGRRRACPGASSVARLRPGDRLGRRRRPAADWTSARPTTCSGSSSQSPEPRPDPDAGRLGGISAPKGLPARRRAGPLLGGGEGVAVMPATRIYEGTRIPSPCPTILGSTRPARPRRHPADQLRAEPPLDPRCPPADRRPRRRARRRHRGGHRLPAHGLREDDGAQDVLEGDHVPRADRLPLLPGERARLRARDREAARASRRPRRRPGCGCASPS